MRDLLTAGLVEQVIPQLYVDEVHFLEEAFLRYIDTRMRRSNMSSSQHREAPVSIHIEKVGNIGNELVERGLATYKGYPWYEVKPWAADSFMAYLAATLGQVESVNSAPVTDSQSCFSILGGVPSTQQKKLVLLEKQRPIRTVILSHLFPSPRHPVSITDIVSFKEHHGDSLRRLRRKVEDTCTQIALIEDTNIQEERLTSVIDEFEDEIAEVTSAMKSKWKRIVFNSLFPLIGAGITAITTNPFTYAAGAVTGLSLCNAVYQAFDISGQHRNVMEKPLAYAALSRKDLS